MHCLDRVTSCVVITVSYKLRLHVHVLRQENGRAENLPVIEESAVLY